MTSDQIRMARALLRWSIDKLAEISRIDKMAVVRAEAGRRTQASTLEKIRKAFEDRNVVFVGATEPLIEATVAFRYGTSDGTETEAEQEAANEGDHDEASTTEALKGYWSGPGRWARLSPRGQEAIGKLLGSQRQA